MGKERKRPHRGRKRRGGVFSTILLILSLCVFGVSGFMLFTNVKEYKEGRDEYKKVEDIAVSVDSKGEKFRVDFGELKKINIEVVGWLRFHPEPKEINYPVVQTSDNETYLNKTFSDNDNHFGTIFLDCSNKPDFSDTNSILYGHNMKDGSMFAQLMKYEDQAYWDKNQYFYMYTPDGMELVYHIFAAGVVPATDETYNVSFETDEAKQSFISRVKEQSAYDTGIEITTADTVMTLSTCTNVNDSERFVVRGVLERSAPVEGD